MTRTPIVAQDFAGRRFGRLVSLGRSQRIGRDNSYCIERVQCDCGTIKEVDLHHLRGGFVISCGCARKIKRPPPTTQQLRDIIFDSSMPIPECGCWIWMIRGCGLGVGQSAACI